MSMREAVIVSAVRTAVGKAPAGSLRHVRPDEMAAVVIREALRRAEPLEAAEIEDVILGCAYPEAEQGSNVGRIASLRAGLPSSVPGMTVNRFCASGLQAVALAAQRIMTGEIDVAIAGGTESMSLIRRGGNAYAPNPALAAEWPGVYTSMGLTAENVAEQFGISRQDADEFGFRSHWLASSAIQEGKFRDEIIPLKVEIKVPDCDGQVRTERGIFDTDEGVRHDPDMEAMAKLRPVFKVGGVVTAGNSSQTSDGASAVVAMEATRAKQLGLRPLVRFVGFAVGAVPPEIMGMGPTQAVPKVMARTGMRLAEMDLIELNEAFACQALAVIRELDLNLEITNVNGGAVALGHPLGATGAKLTTQIIHEMRRRESRYGLVTMCIGGGQGAAAVFENLQ
jgi:acetyl-CoA acyltransferase